MHLVHTLPPGPLDIVGDIHGEITALRDLLSHLKYDESGAHAQGRKLVFVGDLIDRGPDSHGVVMWVREMVSAGNAYCILGNHELNLLVDDVKDGSGWFFDERYEKDARNYAPFTRTPREQRDEIRNFLQHLPVALLRDDIRVVHAAWSQEAIDAVATLRLGSVVKQYKEWERAAQTAAEASGLYQRYIEEKTRWATQLEDEHNPPPFLEAIAQYDAAQEMANPLKVLTSGIERKADTPFFAGHRWRYSDRVNWWDEYDDPTPVVIGHYWRLYRPREDGETPRYTQLFNHIEGRAWHGKRRNVFCVDFSVGARWRDRKGLEQVQPSRFRLAALQWPENRLVFDNGEIVNTL